MPAVAAQSFFRPGQAGERYAHYRDPPHRLAVAVRQMIEDSWARCSAYVDPNLPLNAMTDFPAAFWELDLAESLMANGIPLVQKPQSEGPDLTCAVERKIYIEATIATPGDLNHPDHVPPLLANPAADEFTRKVPRDQFILRLRNAIEEKHRRRGRYLQTGILRESDPYIIAIRPSGIDFARAEITLPDIVRAVLPFGDEYVTIDLNTVEQVGGGFRYRDTIFKSGGAPVSTTVFQDPAYDGLSTVLYSDCDEVNRPDVPGAGLTLVRNPRATNKVPERMFRFGREYVALDDGSLQRRLHSPKSQPLFGHLLAGVRPK